ncbi:MAG: hypothetical protein ACREUY_01175 [Burkholderiales bacterium]
MMRRLPVITPPGGSPAADSPIVRGSVPTRTELDVFNVNREGWEAIGNTLYDSVAYAAAGQTQLTFFALPIGQGTGFAGGTKTLMDTNMRNPGSLPANQEFLVEGIEVLFWPSRPAVVAQLPAVFGTQAVAQIVNDSYAFYNSGSLILFIGSKNYCEEAPLVKFPPTSNFGLDAAVADTSTVAGNSQQRIAFASARGKPYYLRSPLRLVSNQNFAVSLNWDAAVTITNPGRIFVSLCGVFYRRSQ